MRRIITLSTAVFVTIGGTGFVLSETQEQRQQVQQLSQQVGEDGRNFTTARAVGDQGGSQGAWKVVQANRKAFKDKQAAARAALNGVDGKPTDVPAAAHIATQAFPHMLDGTQVQFKPSQKGVTVTVTKLGQTKPFQQTELSVDQFNDLLNMGADGLYDNLMENGVGRVLQQLSKKPGTPLAGSSHYDLSSGASLGDQWQQRQGTPAQGAPVPAAGAPQDAPAPQASTAPQSAVTPNNPTGSSHFTDLSGGAPAKEPPKNEDLDKENSYGIPLRILRQASQLFPRVGGDAKARNAWIAEQIGVKADRQQGNSYSIRVR
jgi:hypothetical protein